MNVYIRETACYPCKWKVVHKFEKNDTELYHRTVQDAISQIEKHGWNWNGRIVMINNKEYYNTSTNQGD